MKTSFWLSIGFLLESENPNEGEPVGVFKEADE